MFSICFDAAIFLAAAINENASGLSVHKLTVS
jgi:hypothetical protein